MGIIPETLSRAYIRSTDYFTVVRHPAPIADYRAN
jgi:hypothetical protein